MRKFTWLGTIFAVLIILGLFLPQWQTGADEGRILVINFDKQKEEIKIYKQEGNYSLAKNELSIPANFVWGEIKANWYAEWKYQGKNSSIYEQDLNWTWERSENSLTGKTEFSSCPIGLCYSLDENNQVKVKAYFTNNINYPLEDLTYKFVVKYSSDFAFDSKACVLSKGGEEIRSKPSSDVLKSFINSNFNEVDKAEITEFLMYVGTVEPGEYSEASLDLF